MTATWWCQATPAVNYYRAEMPARHLPGETRRLGFADVQKDAAGTVFYPRQHGAAVWMFPGNTTRALVMAGMQQAGIRVLVEVDDNYTTLPPVQRLTEWSTRLEDTIRDDRHSFPAHKRIVGWADGVIVSTARLAQVYRRLNPRVYVCRNAVDPADWPAVLPRDDGVIRVGWGASDSHAYDAHDIYRACSWAADQPNVEVVMLGIDPVWEFPYQHVPWVDSLAGYRQALLDARLDVMLCPLRPSGWADCKSDVKALEAAMAGACTVVSRVEPYRDWWDGDAPAYSAGTPKEFLKTVRHLVRHPEEARETARLARQYALERRNIEVTIDEWRVAVTG